MTKITFIGAGSTIFMQNIVGDALLTPALADSHFALMDIDPQRLAESEAVARSMIRSVGAGATVSTHTDRRAALDGADFVITAFQVGDTSPARSPISRSPSSMACVKPSLIRWASEGSCEACARFRCFGMSQGT